MRGLPTSASDAASPDTDLSRMCGLPRIVVIGLGYVGLPLAVALARKFDVIGFDVDPERIAELRAGYDRTREVPEAELGAPPMNHGSTAPLVTTSTTSNISRPGWTC